MLILLQVPLNTSGISDKSNFEERQAGGGAVQKMTKFGGGGDYRNLQLVATVIGCRQIL